MPSASTPGIFLNGSYGVGKSSALEHLGDLFAQQGTPFSLFDVDWFHRSWPPSPHDPDNTATEALNMRATWRNYLRAGPRTPIIAGVIRTQDDLARYEGVFQRALTTVHLTASPKTAELRLRRRYDPDRSGALSWHLERHVQLATELRDLAGHELTVSTDELTPAQVASTVFDALGLRRE